MSPASASPGTTECGAITLPAARLWLDDDVIRCDCRAGINHTKADAERLLASMWELSEHRRLPVLVDMREIKAVERAARVHLSGPDAARTARAVALLVGTPLSRAVGNFFIGLSRPLMPTRLFTAEVDALAWLRGFLA
ncbi:MAG: hypothetical protein ABI193_01140 [Minicystis sp.]